MPRARAGHSSPHRAVDLGRPPRDHSAVVALHQLGHGGPGGLPVGLVADDPVGRVGPPALELGHRGHDRVVLEDAPPAGIDVAGHEVTADEVERG